MLHCSFKSQMKNSNDGKTVMIKQTCTIFNGLLQIALSLSM